MKKSKNKQVKKGSFDDGLVQLGLLSLCIAIRKK